MHRLRRQPQMAHHGNADLHQPRSGLDDSASALELDGRRAALLDQPSRIAKRLGHAHLVGHERHVGHDQRALGATSDRARVVNHGVERDRDGGRLAHDDHAHRIAHQQRIDAGAVEQPRHRGVVGGKHGDSLTALLFRLQVASADWLGSFIHRSFSRLHQDSNRHPNRAAADPRQEWSVKIRLHAVSQPQGFTLDALAGLLEPATTRNKGGDSKRGHTGRNPVSQFPTHSPQEITFQRYNLPRLPASQVTGAGSPGC